MLNTIQNDIKEKKKTFKIKNKKKVQENYTTA